LMEQVEAARARVLAAKSASPSKVAQDVEEMRGRLAGAQPGAQPSEPSNERDDVAAAPRHVGAQNWDAKSGPGRLQDVELIAQMGALLASSSARSTSAQLEASVKAGWFAPSEADDLRDAAALFGRLQAASKLLTSGKLQPGQIGEGGRQFILRETAIAARETLDIAALSAQLDAVAGRARSAIAAIITRLRDSEQIAE
ncbi:MAG: hypothetical protein JKX69_16050, partial [Rhodobacteraceae bacterium]|nr:hypothetical protein [Paracoccaceae bacterium]